MSPDLRIQPFVPASLGSRSVAADAGSPESDRTASTPGHAAGYAAGYAAGARAAAEQADADRARLAADHDRREALRDAQVRDALAALHATASQWSLRAAPVLDEAEHLLHSAALEIAEAIVGRELQTGTGSATTALARALNLPDEVEPTRIRLCPSDLEHIQRAVDGGDVELPAGTVLAADPRLTPGDAVTEYQDGTLDARIGTALQRVRRALLEDEEM